MSAGLVIDGAPPVQTVRLGAWDLGGRGGSRPLRGHALSDAHYAGGARVEAETRLDAPVTKFAGTLLQVRSQSSLTTIPGPSVWHLRDDCWLNAVPFHRAAPRLGRDGTLSFRRVHLRRRDAVDCRVQARACEYAEPPEIEVGPPKRLQ